MKTNDSNENADPTNKIRSALYFLMFIETKLIKRHVHNIDTLDMDEVKDFAEFMSRYGGVR